MNYKYLHTGLDGREVYAAVVDGVEVASFVKGENQYYKAMREDVITNSGAALDVDVPDWLQADADQTLFDRQLADYRDATARLDQYVVADGQTEVTEQRETGEQVLNDETGQLEALTELVVVTPGIEPADATVGVMVWTDEEGNERTRLANEEETPDRMDPNPAITKDNEERAAAQAVVDATPQAVKDAS